MRIYRVSKYGYSAAEPAWSEPGQCYVIRHGETGREQWQIKIKLSPVEYRTAPPPPNTSYTLLEGRRRDSKGNPTLTLAPGVQADPRLLVLLSLDPEPGFEATYEVAGGAEVLAEGLEVRADGARAPCPVILIEGVCQLKWRNPNGYCVTIDHYGISLSEFS